ncbi:DnaJ family domain-containing protein [Nocardioides korecus]
MPPPETEPSASHSDDPAPRGRRDPRVGGPDPDRARDARTGQGAAVSRIHHQARWVDLQIQQAMARGDFDDLPGAGKPLGDLGSPHDRDWWLRRLIEREQITGVLPAALQLRKEDAELDALLDRETSEKVVRGLLEDFNRRVVEARRQLQGGPPVVTPLRDVEAEVGHWRGRLDARRRTRTAPPEENGPAGKSGQSGPGPRRRHWWSRRPRTSPTPPPTPPSPPTDGTG